MFSLELVAQLVNNTSRHLLYYSFKIKGTFNQSNWRLVILLELGFMGLIEKLPDYKHLPYHHIKLVLNVSELEEDVNPKLDKLKHTLIPQIIGDTFCREANDMFQEKLPSTQGSVASRITFGRSDA